MSKKINKSQLIIFVVSTEIYKIHKLLFLKPSRLRNMKNASLIIPEKGRGMTSVCNRDKMG